MDTDEPGAAKPQPKGGKAASDRQVGSELRPDRVDLPDGSEIRPYLWLALKIFSAKQHSSH